MNGARLLQRFRLAHSQGDALLFLVYLQYPDRHNITDGEQFGWVTDAALGDLADVDQTVLMNADIHKDPKVYDITHGAGELHTGFQILDFHYIGAENGLGKFIAGIPAGLQKLIHDVQQGGHAYPALLSGLFPAICRYSLPELTNLPSLHISQRVSC